MIRFFGYFRSSAAYRCRIAFNLKGVFPDSAVSVHLRRGGGEQKRPEYTGINPQALVPALDVDGEVLTQSLAIIEWLEETHPQPAFLPAEPIARARVRAMAQLVACDVHPLQNLRVLEYLRSNFGQDQVAVDAWCRHWVGEGLAAFEQLLARRAKQTVFASGERPGLADICLVPQAYSADRFGVSLDAYRHVVAVRAACEALPAFAEAHPSRQPDSES